MEQTNGLNVRLAGKCDRLHTIAYRPATAVFLGHWSSVGYLKPEMN